MNKLNIVDWISLVLLVIGGLNWGLIGIFKYNLVASIFGDMTSVARIIYILVGLAGPYVLASSANFTKR